ncbi:hypothetical protein CIB93_27110 [Streptomyces sp. WZ.A104]|uniref:DUF3515 family protein n=1 Tax=Streptomyces sp. WZ.A104 TaxID=2023771 RepID=UPI000BBC2FE4|nr:DUF3515 family protein [Streptomyces sp. WZ.A104]PCG82935.1 hypothetical protein CIB93_27110 [Streptomyces sp. WZ.A104]
MTKLLRGTLCVAAALTACTALLAGCGLGGGDRGYSLVKPPFSGGPACTALTDRLPEELGGHRLEKPGVDGAAAWGEGDIILYCGMPEPAAAGDCRTVGGVDWVGQKPADDGTAEMFATWGRDTTVQVRFAGKDVGTAAVLQSLAPVVKQIKEAEAGTAGEASTGCGTAG